MNLKNKRQENPGAGGRLRELLDRMDPSKPVIIATDIDGTLVDDKKRIPANVLEAVEAFVAQGGIFVAATGRFYEFAKLAIAPFSFSPYIISANGTYIRHTSEAEPLYEKELPRSIFERICDICEGFGHQYQVYDEDSIVSNSSTRFLEYCKEQSTLAPEGINFEIITHANPRTVTKVHQVSCVHKDKPLDDAIDALSKVAGLSVTDSRKNGVEIIPSGHDKGVALVMLAKKLGIPMQNTIAFGDAENDINMLKVAGIGIAVENATDSVKEVADLVVGSNQDGGMAEAIALLNLV